MPMWCLLLYCWAGAGVGAAAADCVRQFKTMTREVSHDTVWVERVFTEAGCSLVILPQAERILDRLWSLKTGEIDFISAATPLPERSEYAWFSIPYAQERVVMVAHERIADTLQVGSMAALVQSDRYVIGPHFGYYGPDWEKTKQLLLQAKRFTAYKNWGSARGMLIRKPDSILIVVDDAARDIVAKPNPPLRVLPNALYQSDIVLMFSRKTVSAADVEHVNAAIARLLARGVNPSQL